MLARTKLCFQPVAHCRETSLGGLGGIGEITIRSLFRSVFNSFAYRHKNRQQQVTDGGTGRIDILRLALPQHSNGHGAQKPGLDPVGNLCFTNTCVYEILKYPSSTS